MSSDLQNKMYHFETDPPKEVWNKIADALDADAEQPFPQRLFTYEEQPPAHIWTHIESSLEETEPAIKVVPITRYKKPLRYVAAAASIIAVIFFVATLNNKQTGAGSVIGTETVNTTNQSSILPLDKPQPVEVPLQEQGQASDLSVAVENHELDQPLKKKSIAPIRPQSISRSFAFAERFIPRKAAKENFFDFSELDNYMVYSDENGNAVKLPKKLYSLVHCEDGDYSCQERIKTLQRKMASSATTTDFGGILEIIRQLQ